VPRRSEARRRFTRDRCSLCRIAMSDAPTCRRECAYLIERAALWTPIFSK
jgi:hypothetical protein